MLRYQTLTNNLSSAWYNFFLSDYSWVNFYPRIQRKYTHTYFNPCPLRCNFWHLQLIFQVLEISQKPFEVPHQLHRGNRFLACTPIFNVGHFCFTRSSSMPTNAIFLFAVPVKNDGIPLFSAVPSGNSTRLSITRPSEGLLERPTPRSKRTLFIVKS